MTVEGVIHNIESNLNSKFNLGNITSAAHYSKYHLHQMLTSMMGMTIHDYIERRQLAQAAKLLVFSDLPIIDIAFEYGYESQQAFSVAFKAMYNASPGKYRYKDSFIPYNYNLFYTKNSGVILSKEDIRFVHRVDVPDWMELMRLVIDRCPVMDESQYQNILKKCIDERRG